MQPGPESPEPAPQAGSQPAPPLAEGTPETTTPRVRTRASEWATATPYRLPLAVAAVGLVISAPFGGWRTAEPEGPATIAPETELEAAPFEVTVQRAYYSPQPSQTFSELEPGQLYVVVLGTVTNHHETSVTGQLFSDSVEVTDLPDAVDMLTGLAVEDGEPVTGQLYSAQDSTGVRLLGPDLTYDFGLVLVTGAETLPDELTVEVSGHTWSRGIVSGEEDWRDPETVARIMVPLAEQKTPAEDPAAGSPSPGGRR